MTMPDVNAGRILVTLEGRDVNLTDLLTKVQTQMQRGVSSARQYDTTLAGLTNTTRREEAARAQYAQALARSAVAAGNDAQAIRILAQTMQQLTPNTTAAVNVLNQLQNTLNRQTAAAQQTAAQQARLNAQQSAAAQTLAQQQASSITNAVTGLQRLAGAYFAVTTIASTFTEAISAGNRLEKADATFRALSGSTAAYEENLATAREQQARFGGSLEENIDGLSQFANLSKRTGVDIKELANTARALAVIDPVQGFKGAGIALKESNKAPLYSNV